MCIRETASPYTGETRCELRILFIHEVSYLKKPIYEMHEFPEALANLGHDVTFLQFDEGFSRAHNREPFHQRISGRVYQDATIDILTPWQSGYQSIDRLLATLTHPWAVLVQLVKNRPDLVFCYSVPTSGWQSLIISRLLGVPFVYRAIDVSHKIRKTLWQPAVFLAERFIVRNADLVSTNNPAMSSYIGNRFGRKSKTDFHAPPLDLKLVTTSTLDLRMLQRELGLNQRSKCVIYFGTLFYFSGLVPFLRSFRTQLEKDKDLVLLIVGGGEQEDLLRQEVRALGVEEQVIFTGVIPFTEIGSYLSLCRVGINPMEKKSVSDFALPNKVLQYLANGLRVVSTPLEGLKAIFGKFANICYEDNYENFARTTFELSQLSDKPEPPAELSQFSSDESVVNLERSIVQLARSFEK